MPKKKPGAEASPETLKRLNAALERFNDTRALNHDGPGKWEDWVIVRITSTPEAHRIEMRAGRQRREFLVSPSETIENGSFLSDLTAALLEEPDDDGPIHLSSWKEDSELWTQHLEQTAAGVLDSAANREPGDPNDVMEKVRQVALDRRRQEFWDRALSIGIDFGTRVNLLFPVDSPEFQSLRLTRAQWLFVADSEFVKQDVRDAAPERAKTAI